MIGYPIHHRLINLIIRLEELDKLHVHEEFIPSIVNELINAIHADGYVKHPVIVDHKDLVVLDGIHRVAVLKKLGCRYIPVCLVEYDNPHILLGSWYRVIHHSNDLLKVVGAVKELGFHVEESSREMCYELVTNHKALTSIVSNQDCFVVYGPQRGNKAVYNAIRQIELDLLSRSYQINYETEEDASKTVLSNDALLLLVVPPLSKKEVVETALKGDRFAPKTTRHTIPARPLFVNVPLDVLCSHLTIEDVNENLIDALSTKTVEHYPPGQILDRRYEEELYVFK